MSFRKFILISDIFKTKSIDLLENLIKGNSREVKRIIDKEKNSNIIYNIYNHLNKLCLPPTHIDDNLYLGNAYNAYDKTILSQYEIEVILNATKEIPCYHKDIIEYHQICIYDNENSYISNYLEEAYDFILKNSKKKYFGTLLYGI